MDGVIKAGFVKMALVMLIGAMYLSATTIVVSFPAYDKVLKEAFPEANVVLLTKGVSDPHEYQLTASDVEFLHSLTSRDVLVLSMHAPFEFKIAEMAERGEIKAKVIDLTKLQLYLTFDGKVVSLDEHHDHGHEHRDDHHHGHDHGDVHARGVNLHDHGLFPPNVFKLVDAVSKATGLSPDEKFMSRLKALNATYCCKFKGRAVAVTPAAQYVLYWLGFRDIVVFIKEPGVPPTPEDLQKALQYAREGAPVLAAVVRGEALRLVSQFVEKAREAGVEPRLVVADFSKGYLSTLENMTRQLDIIYSAGGGGQTAATPTTQHTGATSEFVAFDVWGILLAVVVAAALAALVVLKRRK